MPSVNEREFARARKTDAAKLKEVQRGQAAAAGHGPEDLRRGYRSLGSARAPEPTRPTDSLSDEEIEARHKSRFADMIKAATKRQ